MPVIYPTPPPAPAANSTQYFSGLTGAQQQTLQPWQQMWSALTPSQQTAMLNWANLTPAQIEQQTLQGQGGGLPPIAAQVPSGPANGGAPGNARGGRPEIADMGRPPEHEQRPGSPLAHAIMLGLILHHAHRRLRGGHQQ